MAGGDQDDILRSLRRYLSLMLGSPPWTVRAERVRVADDQRPVAVVEASSPLVTLHARRTIPQGDVQKAQAFAAVAYPVLEASSRESRHEADRIGALIDRGFTHGLVTDDVPPKNIGGPFGLPVYDFAGVAMTGSGRRGPSVPYMHAHIDVANFNVRSLQDPLDELRFTVAAAIRVLWWQSGRLRPDAPLAVIMPGGWHPPPPLPPPYLGHGTVDDPDEGPQDTDD